MPEDASSFARDPSRSFGTEFDSIAMLLRPSLILFVLTFGISCSLIDWDKCRNEDQFCFGISHYTNLTSLDADTGCLARYDCTIFVIGNKIPDESKINLTVAYNYMIIQKLKFTFTIRPANDEVQIISPLDNNTSRPVRKLSSTIGPTDETITEETSAEETTTNNLQRSWSSFDRSEDEELETGYGYPRSFLEDETEDRMKNKNKFNNDTDYGVSFIFSLDKDALINHDNHLLTIDHVNSEIFIEPKVVTLNHRFMFFRYITNETEVGFNTSNTPVNVIGGLMGLSSTNNTINIEIFELNMTLFGDTKKIFEDHFHLTEHRQIEAWVPPILLVVGIIIAVLLIILFDKINNKNDKPKSPKAGSPVEIKSEESTFMTESVSDHKEAIESSESIKVKNKEPTKVPPKV